MAALTYERPITANRLGGGAAKRRPQQNRIKSSVQRLEPVVRKLATQGRTLADAQWPQVRHRARNAWVRWLTIESTTVLLVMGAASLVAQWTTRWADRNREDLVTGSIGACVCLVLTLALLSYLAG